jgi:hypothetical protein
MQASFEIERDDLDRWIAWALAACYENVRPPEQVWRRVVRHIAISEGAGAHTRRGKNALPGVPVRAG